MTGRTIMQAAALPALAALSAWTLAVTPAAAQEDERGAAYRYGRYCGPGVPSFAAAIGERDGRLQDLQGQWPPADDIDAFCFSHDYCFEMLGMDSLVCDNAIKAVLSSYAQTAGPSCSARATNMAQAFDLKPWSRSGGLGVVPGVLNAARNARNLDGEDLGDAAARQAVASFGSGEAGACNISGAPAPATAVGLFVAQVQAQGVSDFSICTPDALASGACAHTVPTAQPSAASSLVPAAAGEQQPEVEAAGRALRGLLGR